MENSFEYKLFERITSRIQLADQPGKQRRQPVGADQERDDEECNPSVRVVREQENDPADARGHRKEPADKPGNEQ